MRRSSNEISHKCGQALPFKGFHHQIPVDTLELAIVNSITGDIDGAKTDGLGVQGYQVLFLFESESTFNNFVDNGWQADASAQAAAGKAAVGAQTGFINGMAIYQITDKGLIASVDVAGTKYSKNDKLNE